MWTILGYPFTTIAVPVWIKGGKELPNILTADEKSNAQLCDMALTLKKQCYPIERGSGYKYLNITALINKEKTGILQKLEPIEKVVFEKTEKQLENWNNKPDRNNVQEYYHWLSKYVINEYQTNFF